ncbi:MAG: hypothetical protein MUO68_14105, partial [Desulfobacteraceae bacterium]|nr:hypothetical protein [Desulfobacteraceae bacterium]
MNTLKPISLDGVKSYPLKERESKVNIDDFARAWEPGDSMNRWLESLPRILAGKDLLEIRDRMVLAASSNRTIILAMGAHAIKVGLNPIIIDLLDRGII